MPTLTERVVVASKGRLDRAVSRPERKRRGLPHENTIEIDDINSSRRHCEIVRRDEVPVQDLHAEHVIDDGI